MKGVSAVIATILLLLIVIAIVGFAFGFFQRFFGIATSQGTTQLTNIQGQTDYSLRVESVSTPTTGQLDSTVLIRNLGTQTVSTSVLGFFVDGAQKILGTGVLTCPTTIASNVVGSCVIIGTTSVAGCPSGSDLLITTPGMSATYTC